MAERVSRLLKASLLGAFLFALSLAWTFTQNYDRYEHLAIIDGIRASFLSNVSVPPIFQDSPKKESLSMENMNGVIFTSCIVLVLVGYGLYYSYTHRANSAQEVERLIKAEKVPGHLSETVNNLVEQQIATSQRFNPAEWLTWKGSVINSSGSEGLSIRLLAVLIVVWLVLATVLISITASWPPGMVFFFIINAGLGRGFTIATPYGADSTAGQVSSHYCLFLNVRMLAAPSNATEVHVTLRTLPKYTVTSLTHCIDCPPSHFGLM